MIYYFSGTGNSKWAAERLAALTGDTAARMDVNGRGAEEAPAAGAGERIGLVFPIHAWGAPKAVADFAARIKVDPGAYAYALCTCGDDAGNAMQKLRRVYPWKAAWSLSMPNNYIPMYDADAPALEKAKLAAARLRLPKIAAQILAGKAVFDVHKGGFAGLKTALVNPAFCAFALSTKPFFADENCTACGLCEANCPVGAIQMTDERPIWILERCTQCMACIQRCPARAIQYGKDTKQRSRYFFDESKETRETLE